VLTHITAQLPSFCSESFLGFVYFKILKIAVDNPIFTNEVTRGMSGHSQYDLLLPSLGLLRFLCSHL